MASIDTMIRESTTIRESGAASIAQGRTPHEVRDERCRRAPSGRA